MPTEDAVKAIHSCCKRRHRWCVSVLVEREEIVEAVGSHDRMPMGVTNKLGLYGFDIDPATKPVPSHCFRICRSRMAAAQDRSQMLTRLRSRRAHRAGKYACMHKGGEAILIWSAGR